MKMASLEAISPILSSYFFDVSWGRVLKGFYKVSRKLMKVLCSGLKFIKALRSYVSRSHGWCSNLVLISRDRR